MARHKEYDKAEVLQKARVHNSLIGVRVLAKTTKDKEKHKNIIDSTLAVLDYHF